MSSTNRSDARKSHIADYYFTPVDQIELFLKSFNPDFKGKKILDPCAGGDEIIKMSYPEAILNYCGQSIDTIDIRQDSRANIKADYLLTDFKNYYDVIITNPPFAIAIDIIKKALQDVKENGFVIMLLRLNYFGSKQRFEFFKNNMPVKTFVHHKRLSFTADGKQDSIEYMHAVWQKGSQNKTTELALI